MAQVRYDLTLTLTQHDYPKVEKPSNSSRIILGKSLKRTSYDIKKQRITKFLCVIFFHFKALSCIP